MAKIIDFGKFREEEPDITAMSREELLERREHLRAQIRELDKSEPRNMMSEAYEEWGEVHEELEDLLDEVLDRLDELE